MPRRHLSGSAFQIVVAATGKAELLIVACLQHKPSYCPDGVLNELKMLFSVRCFDFYLSLCITCLNAFLSNYRSRYWQWIVCSVRPVRHKKNHTLSCLLNDFVCSAART